VKSLVEKARKGGDATVAVGEVDAAAAREQKAEEAARKRRRRPRRRPRPRPEAKARAEAEAKAQAEAEAEAAADAAKPKGKPKHRRGPKRSRRRGPVRGLTPRTDAPGWTRNRVPGSRNSVDPPFVVVGQVSKPHGTKGELFVWPLTDHPETTFVRGVRLRVADVSGNLPDPSLEPYRSPGPTVPEGLPGHPRRGGGSGEADALHGRYLVRPFEEVGAARTRGRSSTTSSWGLTVVTPTERRWARCWRSTTCSPWTSSRCRGDRTILIPFQAEVVRDWDLETRRLVITPRRASWTCEARRADPCASTS
jgi:hypothetical protein